jgi:hypothetical protein
VSTRRVVVEGDAVRQRVVLEVLLAVAEGPEEQHVILADMVSFIVMLCTINSLYWPEYYVRIRRTDREMADNGFLRY